MLSTSKNETKNTLKTAMTKKPQACPKPPESNLVDVVLFVDVVRVLVNNNNPRADEHHVDRAAR